MITIATFDNTEQAELLKAQLELAGIRAFVANEAIVTLNWMFANAVGGIMVQVEEADVDQARTVLAESRVPVGELAPLSPYHCPVCGSTKVEFRRNSRAFFMLSLLFLGLPLAFYHPRCHCLDCGEKWKRRET